MTTLVFRFHRAFFSLQFRFESLANIFGCSIQSAHCYSFSIVLFFSVELNFHFFSTSCERLIFPFFRLRVHVKGTSNPLIHSTDISAKLLHLMKERKTNKKHCWKHCENGSIVQSKLFNFGCLEWFSGVHRIDAIKNGWERKRTLREITRKILAASISQYFDKISMCK